MGVVTGNSPVTTSSSGLALDTVATDIQPLGVRAAGSTGKAADASHVHVMPRLDQVSVPTGPVALNGQKITGLANGSASTDAAAFGQVPVIDTTAGHITTTTTGAAAAGAQGKTADSGHQHPIGAHASTHASGGSDPTTPAAIGALAVGQAPYLYPKSGNYYFTFPSSANATSAGQGNGTLRVSTLFLGRACTLNRIGASIQTVGSGGTSGTGGGGVIRLCLFNDDGTGYPGTLVADYGTIDGGVPGSQEITISQALAAGNYWVGTCQQGAGAGVPPTLYTLTQIAGIFLPQSTIPVGNGNYTGLFNTGFTSGAISGTFAAGATVSSATPRCFIKVA